MSNLRRAAQHALAAIEDHGGSLPLEVCEEVKAALRDAIEADLTMHPEPEPEPVKSDGAWVMALARAIERSNLLKRGNDE